MLNKFLPNLDIWNEILGYFEVSLEKDDENVVKEKRCIVEEYDNTRPDWQLSKLVSPRSVGLPDNASGKALLLRNLLYLFPNLEGLGGEGGPMKELSDIFEVVKIMFHKPTLI